MFQWSIDANCAWKPADAIKFLELIRDQPFKSHIFMVEQPFGVDLDQQEFVCVLGEQQVMISGES
jgi:L-alanine-DL-glutamate epimerase-like enolase superfamily enzyme